MPSSRPRRSGSRGSQKAAKPGSGAAGKEKSWTIFDPASRWWSRHPRIQLLCAISGFTAGILFVAAAGLFLHYDRKASRFDLQQVARMPRESAIYDIQGASIGSLHGDGRTVMPLDQVSENFLNALIAREDSRFFKHGGYDAWALVRASLRNARDGDTVQGASTLTMQLARNTFGMREKTLNRKLIEIALARRIEADFTKEEILYLYVNRIFFGTGFNGIEQAARGYFGKPAADLDLAESAMIAGIIRAPNRFSPFRHYDDAIREMQDTLDRMAAEGMLTTEEAEAAKRRRPAVLEQAQGLQVAGKTGRTIEDSFLIDAVRRELERLLTRKQLDRGGFEIFTTFDLDLQRGAKAAVERRLVELELRPGYPHPVRSSFDARFAADEGLAPDYLQAAVSVIDNRSGAIRAMIGGRDFTHSRFNRATQAKRQLGSVFKPLVYATAFENGLFPGTYISDDPIREVEIAWSADGWSPENSDGKFLGLQTAATGLVRSRNTMSVRVGERAGIESVLAMIEHAGLKSPEETDRTPQIYIGNLGASLNSLVSAYSAFPNAGRRPTPFLIERIENRDGTLVYEYKPAGYRVVSPGASWLVTRILQDALEDGGTGAAVRQLGLEAPAGGKTGTTKNFRDAWFVGFTSKLSAGVWVGMDQPEKIIDSGYGGRLALPIWNDIMLKAQELGYVFRDLPQPDDLMEIELCRFSGHLATDTCRRMKCAYRETVPHPMIPRRICSLHNSVKREPAEELTETDPESGFFGKVRGILGID